MPFILFAPRVSFVCAKLIEILAKFVVLCIHTVQCSINMHSHNVFSAMITSLSPLTSFTVQYMFSGIHTVQCSINMHSYNVFSAMITSLSPLTYFFVQYMSSVYIQYCTVFYKYEFPKCFLSHDYQLITPDVFYCLCLKRKRQMSSFSSALPCITIFQYLSCFTKIEQWQGLRGPI